MGRVNESVRKVFTPENLKPKAKPKVEIQQSMWECPRKGWHNTNMS